MMFSTSKSLCVRLIHRAKVERSQPVTWPFALCGVFTHVYTSLCIPGCSFRLWKSCHAELHTRQSPDSAQHRYKWWSCSLLRFSVCTARVNLTYHVLAFRLGGPRPTISFPSLFKHFSFAPPSQSDFTTNSTLHTHRHRKHIKYDVEARNLQTAVTPA